MVMAAKQYNENFRLHNSLVDVRNFIKREIDLLNSIDDSKNLAQRQSYKDSFISNLQTICKSIDDNLDKTLCKKKGLLEQREALANNLQMLIDKQ